MIDSDYCLLQQGRESTNGSNEVRRKDVKKWNRREERVVLKYIGHRGGTTTFLKKEEKNERSAASNTRRRSRKASKQL